VVEVNQFETNDPRWQMGCIVANYTGDLTEAYTHADRTLAKRAFDAMLTMTKIDIAAIEAAMRGKREGMGVCAWIAQ